MVEFVCAEPVGQAQRKQMAKGQRRLHLVDGTRLSISIPLSAQLEFKAQSQFRIMKIFVATVTICLLTHAAFAQEKPFELKDDKDKASYSIGLNIGTNLKRQNVDLNPDALMAGMSDAMSGKKPLLNEQEVREAMMSLEKDMQQKQLAAAQKNAGEGEKFLAENKTKPGVKATASGLQYKVEKEGSGPKATANDTVTVNYRGTLINGTEFDSSYKRGRPATFPVNGVIKGWTEALQLMKGGSKYQLFIPANLAYGERGAGGDIGPNSMLIFDVELLDVKPAGTSTSTSPSASVSASAPGQPNPAASPK
jgi:FKBP-type peptidyl-prolyl cis-trans isomerase FklB